jgi:hypothetical protein
MEDTVKITGKALTHLKLHSGLIREFMANSNENDMFEIPVHLLPNKDTDAEFLQEWTDGGIVGERTGTNSFTLKMPYTREQVFTLLDFLLYAHPTTLAETFRASPALGDEGDLIITHKMRKPIRTARNSGSSSRNSRRHRDYNYGNSNSNSVRLHKYLNKLYRKRDERKMPYPNENSNSMKSWTKPWAKRANTKRIKREKRTKLKRLATLRKLLRRK